MIYQPSHHGLLDLYGCPAELLRDEQRLTQVLQQAAQTAGATILSSHFHTFGGEGGVTGVLLLAESHISIHTWPEHGFAAADVFLCGSMPLEHVQHYLTTALQAQHSHWHLTERGHLLSSVIHHT